jgi:hypothetical protein
MSHHHLQTLLHLFDVQMYYYYYYYYKILELEYDII